MASKTNLIFKNLPISISYELQKGVKDSIVFIHGLGICKECFKDVWDFPGYAKYTILTFDLPGFGNSDKPTEFSYSMEDQSILTSLIIQELGLEQVHVVGHSMGGAIGLLLTQQIETKLKSFICLEGNLVSEDCTGSRIAVGYSIEDFQKKGFNELKAKVSESVDETFLSCFSKCNVYAFYRSSQSLVEWSDSGKLLDLFLNLHIPKYYIFGQQNKDAPLIRKLSSVPRIMISDAGHGMMADNPESFYKKLLEVLK